MRFRTFFLLLLLHLCLQSLFLFFPQQSDSQGKGRRMESPLSGGTYRRPLEFNPKTLDPALATDIYSVSIIQQLFDGLVQFDRDLNVIPALAMSWKISPDGLTYTFSL